MFKVQNLLYLLMWIINIFSFILAKGIDEIYAECYDKKIFKYKDLFSFVLQTVPFIMIISSIIISVITIFLSDEITNYILSLYFIVTFIDLILTGVLETIFEKQSNYNKK